VVDENKKSPAQMADQVSKIMLANARAQRIEAVCEAKVKRIAKAHKAGRVPAECGPEIPEAPARGEAVAFNPARLVAVGNEGYQRVERGYKGRSALQVLDALQKMNRAMAKRRVIGFTEREMKAASAYVELTERHAAGGLKCSSAFQSTGGGGGGHGRDTMDRLLAMRRKLDECHRAIGSGIAKEVRRIRPSKRGAAGVVKRSIFDRDLVDRVCCGGDSLTTVLRDHGWGDSKENIKAVYHALRAALERLARCF